MSDISGAGVDIATLLIRLQLDTTGLAPGAAEATVALTGIEGEANKAGAALGGSGPVAAGLQSAQRDFKLLQGGASDTGTSLRGATSEATRLIQPLSRLPIGNMRQLASETAGAAREYAALNDLMDKSAGGNGVSKLAGAGSDAAQLAAVTAGLDANTASMLTNAAARVENAAGTAAVEAANEALDAGLGTTQAALAAQDAAAKAAAAALAEETQAVIAAAIAQQALADATGEGAVATQAEAVAALRDALAQAGGAAGGLADGAGAAGFALEGLLNPAVLAGAAAGALAAAEFTHLGDQLYNFQAISGASAEQASILAGEANLLGINATTLGTAVGRLADNIGKGTDGLAGFGVEIAHTGDGATDLVHTVDNIAGKYASLTDPTEKALLAQQAFGRGWMQLAPLLEQGSKGLDDLKVKVQAAGLVMDQHGINQAHQFSENLRTLKQDVEGLALPLGETLVTAINAGAGAYEKANTEVTKLTGGVSLIKSVSEAALGPVAELGHVVDLFGGSHESATAKARKLADQVEQLTGKYQAYTADQVATQQASDKVDQAIAKLTDDTSKHKDAAVLDADALGVQKAKLDETTAALQREAQAQDAVTQALQRGEQIQQAYTTAQENRLKGIEDLPAAQQALATANAKVSEAMQASTVAADAERQAQDRVREAASSLSIEQTKAAEDAQKVADARANLAKVTADLTTQEIDVEKAQEAATQAQLDAHQASVDLADANQKLAQAENGGASPDEIAKAKLAVEQATLKGQEADTNGKKAKQDLTTAEGEHAAAVKKATDELTTAIDEQRSAQDTLLRDTDSLNQARDEAAKKAGNQTDAELDLQGALAGVQRAASDVANDESLMANGTAATVNQSVSAQIQALEQLKQAIPSAGAAIDQLIQEIQSVPGVTISFDVSGNPTAGAAPGSYPGQQQAGISPSPGEGYEHPVHPVPKAAGGAYVAASPGGSVFNVGEGGEDEIITPVPALRDVLAQVAAKGGGRALGQAQSVAVTDNRSFVTIDTVNVINPDPTAVLADIQRQAGLTPGMSSVGV